MEQKEKKNSEKIWYYPLRGALAFIALFLLKSLTTRKLEGFIDRSIPSQFFYAFGVLGIILIYNSIIHTLTFYDKDSFEKFKKRGVREVSFGEELGIVIRSREFLMETIPAVILSVVFAFFGGFYETVYTVFFIGKVPLWAFKVIPTATMPIIVFLVSLFCRYEIHRYWAELCKKGEENRVESKTKFALKIVTVLAMYPLVFPYSPYILFLLITFFGAVGALISLLSVLGFIIAVAGLIFGIIGLQKWKVHRLRSRFIKEVISLAAEKVESVTVYSKEQRAVRGYDLTLTSGGKAYSCKIVTATASYVPLYFTASDAYFLHRLGTKEHHTSLEKHFEYSFTVEEGQKLIVIMKFPKRLFVSEFGATRKLFSGDRIWSYIVFDSRSFLGAMDRECLYRSNDENR